ncbi:uncharacterized protein [Leptinotarsa decemlineata]|uniref:uncharacterized protein n=1 Tax=Leptinotarsa decemlineata TaxID=7539 RepID=UPI003D309908
MEADFLGDSVAVEEANQGSRIREKAPEKLRGKHERYEDPDPDLKQFERPCSHDNNQTYQCQNVKISDIKNVRSKLYSVPNKNIQDVKLCHMISVSGTVRKRYVKDNPRQRTRAANFFLTIIKKKRSEAVKVCRNFLMAATGVENYRLFTVVRLSTQGTVLKSEEEVTIFQQKVWTRGREYANSLVNCVALKVIIIEKNLKGFIYKITLKKISLEKTRIQKTKEIKISLACFQHYRFEAQSEVKRPIFKRGKSLKNFVLSEVNLRSAILPKKIKSVQQLMEKQFGKEWKSDETFLWYKNLSCENNQVEHTDDVTQEEEEELRNECDCLEEEFALHLQMHRWLCC